MTTGGRGLERRSGDAGCGGSHRLGGTAWDLRAAGEGQRTGDAPRRNAEELPPCPGIFQQGCARGGRLLSVPPELPGQKAFYGCSHVCGFRKYFVMQRPERVLELELVAGIETKFSCKYNHGGAVRVSVAEGSEDAVAVAGGCSRLLHSLGVDPALLLDPEEVRRFLGASASTAPDHEAFLPLGRGVYEVLEKRLCGGSRRLSPAVLIPPGNRIPPATLAAFRGVFHKEEPQEVKRRLSAIPRRLWDSLKPFQAAGVRFVLERAGWALIADEMGLGKTIQAIALLAAYRDEWPALVVVPASCRLQWVEELERWLSDLLTPSDIHVIYGSSDRVRPCGSGQEPAGCRWARGVPPVTVTSYHMVERLTCAACKGVKPCREASSAKQGRAHIDKTQCLGPAHCMAQVGWGVVVMDESHAMRAMNSPSGRDSPATEALAMLARRRRMGGGGGGALRCVMLSGTPSLMRPFDLYRQVHCLRPNLLGSRHAFAERYCDRQQVACWSRGHGGGEGGEESGEEAPRMQWNVSGGRFLSELHGLLCREVMVRRLKEDVAQELPDKQRHAVHLPRPPVVRWPTHGEEAEGDWDSGAWQAGEDTERQQHSMSSEHRVGLAKVKDVLEWLEGAVLCSHDPSGEAGVGVACKTVARKLLVFAHHRGVMNLLHEGLAQAMGRALGSEVMGWESLVRIDGETAAQDRGEAVRRFRTSASCRIALLSITAAGTGLDFASASAVVFAELPHDVGLALQAEGRAHRTGCKAPVTVYYLLSKNTVDDRMWQKLGAQLARQEQMLDGATAPGRPDCSRADLADLGQQQLLVDRFVDVEEGTTVDLPRPAARPRYHHGASDHQRVSEIAASALSSCPEPSGENLDGRVIDDPNEMEGAQSAHDDPTVDVSSGGSLCSVSHVSASYDDDGEGSALEGGEDISSSGPAEGLRDGSSSSFAPRSGRSDDAALKAPPATARALDRTEAPAQRHLLLSQAFEEELANESEEGEMLLRFEVSAHTQRVHFQGGSGPLGLAIPMEELLLNLEQPRALWAEETAKRLLEAGMSPGQPLAEAPRLGEEAQGLGVIRLTRALSDAAVLASEWMELRPIERSKLAGRALKLPLQDVVGELKAETGSSGGLGRGTTRRLEGPARGELPKGAEWRPVEVESRFRTGHRLRYSQAFLPDGRRLCLHCLSPVPGHAFPQDAVLPDSGALFCSSSCDKARRIATSSFAGRRALLQLEGGVCQECGLDCEALLRRLQMIRQGTPKWQHRRKLEVYKMEPRFADPKLSKWLQQMITSAVSGNIWHADHVIPVYEGGGGCDIDNLRTLCVRCHSAVTSQQAASRAAERRLRTKSQGRATRGQGAERAVKRRHIDSGSESSDGAEGERAPETRHRHEVPEVAVPRAKVITLGGGGVTPASPTNSDSGLSPVGFIGTRDRRAGGGRAPDSPPV